MDTIPEISTPEVTEEVTTKEVTTKEVTEEEVNYDGWDDEDTTSTEPEEVVVDKVKVDEPKEEVKEEVEETTETKPEPFDYGSLPLKILKDGDRTDAKLSDFTADEIITNFQKGTNYDRLNDQMQIGRAHV